MPPVGVVEAPGRMAGGLNRGVALEHDAIDAVRG